MNASVNKVSSIQIVATMKLKQDDANVHDQAIIIGDCNDIATMMNSKATVRSSSSHRKTVSSSSIILNGLQYHCEEEEAKKRSNSYDAGLEYRCEADRNSLSPIRRMDEQQRLSSSSSSTTLSSSTEFAASSLLASPYISNSSRSPLKLYQHEHQHPSGRSSLSTAASQVEDYSLRPETMNRRTSSSPGISSADSSLRHRRRQQQQQRCEEASIGSFLATLSLKLPSQYPAATKKSYSFDDGQVHYNSTTYDKTTSSSSSSSPMMKTESEEEEEHHPVLPALSSSVSFEDAVSSKFSLTRNTTPHHRRRQQHTQHRHDNIGLVATAAAAAVVPPSSPTLGRDDSGPRRQQTQQQQQHRCDSSFGTPISIRLPSQYPASGESSTYRRESFEHSLAEELEDFDDIMRCVTTTADALSSNNNNNNNVTVPIIPPASSTSSSTHRYPFSWNNNSQQSKNNYINNNTNNCSRFDSVLLETIMGLNWCAPSSTCTAGETTTTTAAVGVDHTYRNDPPLNNRKNHQDEDSRNNEMDSNVSW